MIFFDVHTHRKGVSNAVLNLEDDSRFAESGYFSTGIHPWNLDENWEEKFGKIRKLSKRENCLAIGETGFDRIWGPDAELQQMAFRAQAGLAWELGIPLILHLVKGHDLLVEYLKKESEIPAIIWHGFNQKTHLAEEVLDFPVYFSFGKALLQENSNAGDWLKKCPEERVFFETDDSDLAIDSIFRAASLILRRSVEELRQQTLSNWNSISKRKIE